MNNQASTHEMRQNYISGLFTTALISRLRFRSVFLFFSMLTLSGPGLYPTLTVQESPELADLFELREESGASLCQEVTKLTTALQEYQLMVQVR